LAIGGEPNQADDRCPGHQTHRVWDGDDEGTPGRVAKQVPSQTSGSKRDLATHQDSIEKALTEQHEVSDQQRRMPQRSRQPQRFV
jgi:hypothetical protein